MSTKWTFVRVVYHEAPRGQAEDADRLARLLQGREDICTACLSDDSIAGNGHKSNYVASRDG